MKRFMSRPLGSHRTAIAGEEPDHKDNQQQASEPPTNHRATVIVAATATEEEQKDEDQKDSIHIYSVAL
jgi:hypothetical protein